MSSTTNRPATTPLVPRIITHLFTIAVIAFLLGGAAIVITQSIALAGGDATAARDWEETLTPLAFGGASVAGLLAFVLTYWHGENEDGHDDTEEADDSSATSDPAARTVS
jgi:hypothetical protein